MYYFRHFSVTPFYTYVSNHMSDIFINYTKLFKLHRTAIGKIKDKLRNKLGIFFSNSTPLLWKKIESKKIVIEKFNCVKIVFLNEFVCRRCFIRLPKILKKGFSVKKLWDCFKEHIRQFTRKNFPMYFFTLYSLYMCFNRIELALFINEKLTKFVHHHEIDFSKISL